MSDRTKPVARSGNDRKRQPKPDPAVSYDEFKEFEGRKYTGAKVGRHQKWYYDRGEWKEQKITPDLWQFSYAVTKRRAGRAPEGSGVPVGTEYHWYILAHQNVHKLNANDYTTSMTGLKYKVAHKRADREKWSATEKTQRKRMIAFLKDVIRDLEREQVEEPVRAEEPAAATKEERKPAARKAPEKAAVRRADGRKKPEAKKPKPAARPKRPEKRPAGEQRGYA